MDNKQILEYLEECISPMTVESISDKFRYPQREVQRALDELMVGQRIKKITPENSNTDRVYYTVRDEKITISDENAKTDLDNGATRVKTVVDQVIVNAKDNYEDLTVKIEGIDKNVNGIYVNIVSMMAIFVAIFALITVNANIVFTLTDENVKKVLVGIIAINIFVVICIIALLVGVRFIIIKPLLDKKQR